MTSTQEISTKQLKYFPKLGRFQEDGGVVVPVAGCYPECLKVVCHKTGKVAYFTQVQVDTLNGKVVALAYKSDGNPIIVVLIK